MAAGKFAEAMQVSDLRRRIGWVFLGLAIFVLTVHIGIPGVNREVWSRLLAGGELLQFLGMFTGGALFNFSIGALGITPYINASIIMQLLTVVIPQLHDLQKEGGELGRRKIAWYTRCLTMTLAFLQSLVMTLSLANYKPEGGGAGIFVYTNAFYLAMVVFTLMAGTAFLMWLGEQMSEKGIGNGVSLLIFGGISLSFPQYFSNTLSAAQVKGAQYWVALGFFLFAFLLLIVGIIYVTMGHRKVPVQYPKRQVGRRVYGGHNTFIPIRVNNAGVISIIFAISILYMPLTIVQMLQGNNQMAWLQPAFIFIQRHFNQDGVLFNLAYAGMVIFFTYFYSAITLNVQDLADNLRKHGGFIPGIRPGRPTVEYLERLLSRITLVSALFLAFIAVFPTFLMNVTGVKSFYLGSTSMLIIVGVALDTMQQIEARLVMRHYQGFMKQ
ncbi:MAG: preprotein translocase subunit SecY [Candidatus Eremiobacterota bacterium]